MKKQQTLVPMPSVLPGKEFVTYYESDEVVMIPKEYEPQAVELRGAWIATLHQIDLPLLEDVEEYKKAYCKALDVMLEYNMNAVYVQVRPMNDAFYPSKYNPFSRYLCKTGEKIVEGKDPGWDVLGFFIEEAKKRNLQFHAWMNPYRVSYPKNIKTSELSDEQLQQLKEEDLSILHPKNYAKQHPDHLIMSVDGQLILDPTLKEVQEFLVNTMEEIVDNYPIDGFHFDDYFYPWNGLDPRMDDTNSYQRTGKTMDLGDFRREGITNLMRQLKSMVDRKNKAGRNILFGISPFAVYKNKTTDPTGSNTKASEAYSMWYADLKKWVEEELLHYIMPQIYWEFDHPVAGHADVMDWWCELMKDKKVHLYIGIPLTRFERFPDTFVADSTPNMIRYAQKAGVSKGFVVWNNARLYQNHLEPLVEAQKKIKELWSTKATLPVVDL